MRADVDAGFGRRIGALRPELAARLGPPGEGASLPAPGQEGRAALISLCRAWRDARAEAPRAADAQLARADAIDQRVFSASLALLEFVHEELREERHEPDLLRVPLAVLATDLFAAEASAEERFSQVTAHIEGLPAYLRAARAEAIAPATERLAAARERIHATSQLFDGIAGHAARAAAGGDLPESQLGDLERAMERAEGALADHELWLRGQGGIPGAGRLNPERLDHVLHLRGLDLSGDEIAELARSAVEEMRIELLRALRQRFPGLHLADVLHGASEEGPPAPMEERVDAFMKRFREHCALTGEFDLPPDEEARVAVAPPGAFDATCDAQYLPPRFRATYALGWLLRSPDSAQERGPRAEALEHDLLFHLYPGRHFMQVWADRMTSLARAGVPCGSASPIAATWALEAELGWGTYAERRMRERRFARSPESAIFSLVAGRVQALRAYIDVGLAQGAMTSETAQRILIREAGMSTMRAAQEVSRQLTEPTAALSALVGGLRLEQLRREARSLWRAAYREGDWQRFVLAQGRMPVAYHFESLDARELAPAEGDWLDSLPDLPID